MKRKYECQLRIDDKTGEPDFCVGGGSFVLALCGTECCYYCDQTCEVGEDCEASESCENRVVSIGGKEPDEAEA